MTDWERDLDDFFEGSAKAKQEAADVKERLRREALAFLEVIRNGAKEAGAALNRHGRAVHIMDGRPWEGYPSIEIHVDHDRKREFEYTIGSFQRPAEPTLVVTESAGRGEFPEGNGFGEIPVTEITSDQVRDRLLAVYKVNAVRK